MASKKFSEQELQDMAMNLVKVNLSTVRGASVPYPYGGKARVVAVDLDLAAIQAKNLAPQDVVNAFNAQNFVLPSGTAKIGPTEYNISLNSNPAVLNALNDLRSDRKRRGHPAWARASADGYQPQQNVVRLDGVAACCSSQSGSADPACRRGVKRSCRGF
jgi:multidrug efflux pump subunit AcrB